MATHEIVLTDLNKAVCRVELNVPSIEKVE